MVDDVYQKHRLWAYRVSLRYFSRCICLLHRSCMGFHSEEQIQANVLFSTRSTNSSVRNRPYVLICASDQRRG